MQGDLQLNRKNLPSLVGKQQPISSLFTLIKMKKAQITKQLQQLDTREISLPSVLFQKHQITQNKAEISDAKEDFDIQFENNHSEEPHQLEKTPNNKYKTILDQIESIEKSRVSQREEGQSHFKQQNKLSKPEQKMFSIKTYSRTRTETKVKEERKSLVHNASSMQKAKQLQDTHALYEDSIKKFCTSIEEIPRNMKQRNEQNLTETITQLQLFNPFFNRNNRIINVCLFKMGKIVFKHAPFELYKMGQEIDYLFIILLGKVKLVEGSFKRVCETGETVLEEVIFADKPKKTAFERAKVVSSAYLLQMKLDQYKKMKEQLFRYGLRQQFQQMQAIIKRNFIIKNWMRNKKRLQTCK